MKAKKKSKLLSIAEARKRRPKFLYKPIKPNNLGVHVINNLSIKKIINYIDWSPFFHAWELRGKYPSILNHEKYGEEANKVFTDGKNILNRIINENILKPKAVIGIYDAHAKNETVFTEKMKFNFPRQLVDKGKDSSNFSLADFIGPENDYIGLFALTTGHGLEKLVEEFENQNDDYNVIMAKVIADRLVEAFSEKMHEMIRKDLWGYSKNESLSINDMIKEKYHGIRPAPGYPACPDHTEKQKIWQLMKVKEKAGIELTENFAMYPASSVSGYLFSHPEAKYFRVGKIDSDQLEDYARRKNLALEEARKWLQTSF